MDHTAIIAEHERISRASFAARAAGAASVLAHRHLSSPDRVVCALRNRPEFFEILFGASSLGIECVPVPWRSSADELAYFVDDARAGAAFIEDDAPDVPGAIRLGEYRHERLPKDAAALPPPLMRFYTSGTTGRPKAIERARPDPATYMNGVRSALELLGVDDPSGVHLVCGPLYHAAPLAYATYALLMGQTVVLPLRFDPARALELIEQERVTWTMMAPVHFLRILETPEHERADVSSVRRVLHSAAPCPPDVKRRIMAVFPDAVWEFYGMTEGRATLISPNEWERKPGSVGRAYPGLEIEIRSPEGDALPPGEVGLVYVRDPSRFEYAGAPDKTSAAWAGDAYTVGDMGYLDQDGYLFLTDRAADVIITGGSNVYPAEVEAALHAHPAVRDCAVIGIPDDAWGERVIALVSTRAETSADGLIAHCRARLADFKSPREIVLVDEIPRDEAGKVRRRDLRAPYWHGRERRI